MRGHPGLETDSSTAARAAVLPVWSAWRRGAPRRAVRQAALVLLPLLLALGLGGRALERGRAEHGDDVVALGTLVLLLAGGVLLAQRDARALLEAPAAAPAWWGASWNRLRRDRTAATGATLVAGLALAGLLAPVLAPYDPLAFADMSATRYLAPGHAHWLGTDQYGRDVLSRLLYGARVSLGIGCATALLAVSLGTAVGLAAGFAGGRLDTGLMRGVDILIAFPRLFLLLLVIGLLRPSIGIVVLVLTLTGWMGTARLVRAQVRGIRQAAWVNAAVALGLPARRVVCGHVLPNVTAPILVSVTLMVGQTILTESALSFLGLGVQVPTPSWGRMIDEGRRVFPGVWWVSAFPGLAITLTVVGYNLLGDALRDALDPRSSLRGRP